MKNKKLNIILVIIFTVLLCVFIGITIYNKIDEKNRKYSYSNLLKIYNSIKYDDKVNVYIFHGSDCPHCKKALNFLNNMETEYKDKFNLYKFEVWNNENNAELRKRVIDKLVEDGFIEASDEVKTDRYYNSVPCLVVGNRVIIGYQEELDNDIKKIILEDIVQYDVMKELDLK